MYNLLVYNIKDNRVDYRSLCIVPVSNLIQVTSMKKNEKNSKKKKKRNEKHFTRSITQQPLFAKVQRNTAHV